MSDLDRSPQEIMRSPSVCKPGFEGTMGIEKKSPGLITKETLLLSLLCDLPFLEL